MTINTILVEDEPLSRLFLKNLLAEYCPYINVLASPGTEDEAVEAIELLKPDLVLMDIELQQGNGFSVLQRTSKTTGYDVIYTTALDYTGIKALRFSGVSYLQKPIDIQSLQTAMQRMLGNKQDHKKALEHLLVTLDNDNKPSSIFLHTTAGELHVPLASILFIKMQENACVFYTEEELLLVKNCNLKEFEQLLSEAGFYRPHADYLVQLEKVAAYSNLKQGHVIMKNDAIVPVSPKKQEELKTLLSKFS